MDKDENKNKNSAFGESYRIKRYRKFDKVMSTLVPASVPYSREELEIMNELQLGPYISGTISDPIHHPDHYTWKGMECKDVIEIMTRGLPGAEAYYVGNAIKYLYRYPRKGATEEDLAKAEEYIHLLREYYKNSKDVKYFKNRKDAKNE